MKLNEVLYEYSQTTTCHGWKNVGDKSTSIPRRIAWTIVVLCLIGGLTYTLLSTYIHYKKYNVLTTYNSQLKSEMPFPAITLCSQCKYANMSGNIHPEIYKLLLLYSELPFNKSTIDTDSLMNTTAAEFQEKEAFDWESALMGARFKYRVLDVKDRDLFQLQETLRGRCLTIFSSSYVKKYEQPYITSGGMGSGLSVYLNSLQYKCLPVDGGDAGFVIYIHENNQPVPDLEASGTLVSPGTNVLMKIKPTEYQYLPFPYRSYGPSYCEETDPDYNYETCIKECIQQVTITICGCETIEEVYRWGPKNRNCTFNDIFLCYLPTFASMSEKARNGTLCNCPRPCRLLTYETQISNSLYPSQATYKYISETVKDVSLEDLRENMLVVRIFFNDMNYNQIKHVPEFDIDQIYGMVGGQMGFFLGASLVSVVELLLAILQAFISILGRFAQAKPPVKPVIISPK